MSDFSSPDAASPDTVRVRFAPSPTGHLHVGGARTAIYNELLARGAGGVFVLRIEDTDRERSDEAMVRQIREAMEWLGIVSDEGPFLQSERLERHREAAEALLAAGAAYRAWETPEELDALRAEHAASDGGFHYREGVSTLSAEEVARREAEGAPHVVRFRMPTAPIVVRDQVRGDVEFGPEVFDDFVILRSDASPTYHLSVVVDDRDMGVTHVIRGEDHLSNTPKHIALFRALGAPVPAFAHLPLILGPDKKRLSKRTGATSVEEFRDRGILPQALYNYLALLGWSPGDDRELMSREELVEAFTVERLQSSAAVFDAEKLEWMNGQYIQSLPLEELLEHAEPFLERVGAGGLEGEERRRLELAIEALRPRARTLVELAEGAAPYFRDEQPWELEATTKFRKDPALPDLLDELATRYRALESQDLESLERVLRELADEKEVKAGALIHPLRMALTAARQGPGVFDLVVIQGRERSDRFLTEFIAWLREHPTAEG